MREVKWGLAEDPAAATSHSFIFYEDAVAVLIHPSWLPSECGMSPLTVHPRTSREEESLYDSVKEPPKGSYMRLD